MAARTVSTAVAYSSGLHVVSHSPTENDPCAVGGASSEYATFGSSHGSGADGADAPYATNTRATSNSSAASAGSSSANDPSSTVTRASREPRTGTSSR